MQAFAAICKSAFICAILSATGCGRMMAIMAGCGADEEIYLVKEGVGPYKKPHLIRDEHGIVDIYYTQEWVESPVVGCRPQRETKK